MEMLTDRQTNGRNYTNFERNLAIMVIYLPVKFEFDWTNCFRVKSPETEILTDKRTDQFRKEPSCDGDLSPCQV